MSLTGFRLQKLTIVNKIEEFSSVQRNSDLLFWSKTTECPMLRRDED